MPHEDSPFRSPSLESTQPTVDEEARLLRIVRYQRLTVVAIVVNSLFVCFVLGLFFFANDIAPETISRPANFYWLTVFISMFVVFRLSQHVYSISIGILCCLLMLFIGVGLIAMIVVNRKAIKTLKRHGLQPGFGGLSRKAAVAQLESRGHS